ncbi:hypothetical protein CO057_00045 [Candidatus Uhrbacteria bacterium CG_4_9_14_0_2_um_filter_41_50]|uniref:Uncharacterized protein n=1 Tax=Candidatus Uhrbacteria bacterium CG_4_9_14_0_2_um_filter_41_50 TaxID=1975031 RepID=A0A2M8EQE8_9BACT|nr:MAG: hypothetical protein CO057_00045 [Candidatus Uhrbacteria bacterium CG_4_9_14_0_2_um_filter_41_50]
MKSECQQTKMLHDKRGSLLLEVVISIGLAAIFFSASAGLLIIYKKSFQNTFTNQQVYSAAQQGVNALLSINFSDLTPIENGVLQYNNDTKQWNILYGDPEFITPNITRTVSISEVRRDNDCLIVTTGGETDIDSLYLSTEINWQNTKTEPKTLTSSTLATNWEDPQGNCFAPASSNISLNVSLANWGGAKQLRDVYIINDSSFPVTLTKMTLTWDNASQLQQIFGIGQKLWSDSGPGTPAGTQISGTEIDIIDAAIPANTIDYTHKIQFTSVMSGATLTISIEFSDGSVFTSEPFTPL